MPLTKSTTRRRRRSLSPIVEGDFRTTVDLLGHASALVRNPAGWTQGAIARDQAGSSVDLGSTSAVSFSAFGALLRGWGSTHWGGCAELDLACVLYADALAAALPAEELCRLLAELGRTRGPRWENELAERLSRTFVTWANDTSTRCGTSKSFWRLPSPPTPRGTVLRSTGALSESTNWLS